MRASEYALYKGEELLDIGPVAELAERRGVKEATIRHYVTPRYQRKAKKVRNRMIAIRLDD